MSNQSSNLTMHRAPQNVWDRQDFEHARARAMALLGCVLMAVGACLVGRAYRAELSALRYLPALPKWPAPVDEINRAVEESFPASDPPAWTPAVGRAGSAEPDR